MGLTATAARLAASGVERTLTSRRLQPTWNRRFRAAVHIAWWLHRLDRLTDLRIDITRAGRALLVAVPDAVERLREEVIDRCVLVSATNGKTTTTNMLAAITRSAGIDTVVNDLGANMAGGICTELLVHRARTSRSAGVGVFEVDELWLEHLVDPLRPQVVVLGELHEDQLDRTGGPDRVAERWRRMVDSLPPATALVVNADDPRSRWVVGDHPSVVPVGDGDRGAGRGGRAVVAQMLEERRLDGIRFELSVRPASGPAADGTVDMAIPGRFNVANAVLAAGAAVALGLTAEPVVDGLTRAPRTFGRVEPIDVDGRRITVILAKNAAGLDEVVTMLVGRDGEPFGGSASSGRRLDLLFLLNDKPMDGTDVSWVLDARLGSLTPLVGSVTCGGSRAAEAARAFEAAGVPAAEIARIPQTGAALRRALATSDNELVAITNYSAMLDLREMLAESGHVDRYWR